MASNTLVLCKFLKSNSSWYSKTNVKHRAHILAFFQFFAKGKALKKRIFYGQSDRRGRGSTKQWLIWVRIAHANLSQYSDKFFGSWVKNIRWLVLSVLSQSFVRGIGRERGRGPGSGSKYVQSINIASFIFPNTPWRLFKIRSDLQTKPWLRRRCKIHLLSWRQPASTSLFVFSFDLFFSGLAQVATVCVCTSCRNLVKKDEK